MGAGILENYVRVHAGMPCPRCQKHDWCLVHRDGLSVICKRVDNDCEYGDAGYYYELTEPVEVEFAPEQLTAKLDVATVETLVNKWRLDIDDTRLLALSARLGIAPIWLTRLDLGWRNDCYTFPMRDEWGRATGCRFRFENGDKRSLRGGTDGLFLDTDFIADVNCCCSSRAQHLMITEGPTDCAALWQAGFAAVGRPNCTGGAVLVFELLDRLIEWQATIVADSDAPGVKGAQKLALRIERELGLIVPIIVPVKHKDARECITAGGGRAYVEQAASGKTNEFWHCL